MGGEGMAVIREMTTTAFRLKDEMLGRVYVYRAGEALAAAWQRAGQRQRRPGTGVQLPFRSLVTALRIHASDFVVMQRRINGGDCWIIARRPLDMEWLHGLLQVWEMTVLGDETPGRVSRYLADLHESSLELASLVERRAGRPPRISGAWVWEVARWEMAKRLAARPLEVEGRTIPLRLDSEARLLTWDTIVPNDETVPGRAMHVIDSRIMTLPGVEVPILGLSSRLSRLTNRWFRPHHVWVDLGREAPVLQAEVAMCKRGETWQAEWKEHAVSLLKKVSLAPLPEPGDRPSSTGPVRAPYSRPQSTLSVGKGVGPWFHEAVARHAYGCLESGVSPIVLERVGKRRFPTRDRLAKRHPAGWRVLDKTQSPQVRLCLLYATDAMRHRLLQRLSALLLQQTPGAQPLQGLERLHSLDDGQWCRLGPLEIVFLSPRGAPEQLLKATEPAGLSAWLDRWWSSLISEADTPMAFLVETPGASERDGIAASEDPKPLLRTLLAKRGAVSQFIAADSLSKAGPHGKGRSSGEDHAGHHALIDLLRSAGCFLRAFPAHGVDVGTLLVGIHTLAVSPGKQARVGYRTNLVACVAGTTEAYGYLPKGGWEVLGKATAGYMLSEPWPDKATAAASIRRAVEQLRVRHPGAGMVLFFDAVGNRRLFSCLADVGNGHPDPWMVEGNTAVVRVRSAFEELPRVAGQGNWQEQTLPATSSAFRPMAITDTEGQGATYLVSGSAVQERNQSARKMSRFTATGAALAEDWHSLGVTEFWVMGTGAHEADAILGESLALCRGAPTWPRTLRWPAPLHLARAVVDDHPARSS